MVEVFKTDSDAPMMFLVVKVRPFDHVGSDSPGEATVCATTGRTLFHKLPKQASFWTFPDRLLEQVRRVGLWNSQSVYPYFPDVTTFGV